MQEALWRGGIWGRNDVEVHAHTFTQIGTPKVDSCGQESISGELFGSKLMSIEILDQSSRPMQR